jgi:hypothetical protein
MMGSRDDDSPSVPDLVRQTYREHLERLLAFTPNADEEGGPRPYRLCLSPEAASARRDFVRWLEPRLSSFGELGSIADWAAKLPGAISRIAAILHVALHCESRTPELLPVDGNTMSQAIAIGHYLIPHAQAAFATMGADPAIDDAQHVLNWIERKHVEIFTKRDAFEGTKARFKTVKALDPPLQLLEAHNYIRMVPVEHVGPGRPPSPTFLVHPTAYRSQNPHNSQNHIEIEMGRN